MKNPDPQLLQIMKAMTAEPGNPAHHIDLANYHADRENYAEAAVSLKRAAKLEPENVVYHNNIGICLNAAGKPAEAEKHFRTVLDLAPDTPGANENIAVSLLLQGRPTEAIEAYEESIRSGFNTPVAYSELARIYKARGLTEKAKWYAERFMEEAISGEYASPEMLVNAQELMQEICGGEGPGDKIEFHL